jgi:transposase
MRERVGFIAAVERNEPTFCEMCERFEISRKTGYKWLARYEELGPAGLVDIARSVRITPPTRRRGE